LIEHDIHFDRFAIELRDGPDSHAAIRGSYDERIANLRAMNVRHVFEPAAGKTNARRRYEVIIK
jgi:hypothetical protein